jgi:hypothetical protein
MFAKWRFKILKNAKSVYNNSLLKRDEGFLLIEVLIAGLIITASIASTMYLFKIGFRSLGTVNNSNQLSSKLSQSINLLKAIDIEEEEGTEDVGDGVTLVWKSKLLERTSLLLDTGEGNISSNHELFLYKINFQLEYNDTGRDYELNVLRSKTLGFSSDMMF